MLHLSVWYSGYTTPTDHIFLQNWFNRLYKTQGHRYCIKSSDPFVVADVCKMMIFIFKME